MLDNPKVLVNRLLNEKKFPNCDLGFIIPSRKKKSQFLLVNRRTKFALTLAKCDTGGFCITGSWRKWLLGKKTLRDLTRLEILEACKAISRIIGISNKSLLDAKVLIAEFGLTFYFPLFPSAIIGNIHSYSCIIPARYPTSISFQAAGHWLKVYDKYVEIYRGKAKQTNGAGKFALRIELRAFSFKAIRERFEKQHTTLQTVRDFITNYRNLIISFYKEVRRIEIQPIDNATDNICFHGKKMPYFNAFARFMLIKTKGMPQVLQWLGQLDMAASGKSVQRKKTKGVPELFSSAGTFKQEDFVKAVRMQLIKKIVEPMPLL